MPDQEKHNLARELLEAEALEGALNRFFGSLQPPFGAAGRLLAKLNGSFHESQLTLDDPGPYSFEAHAAAAEADLTAADLLAAGLEEESIDEGDPDQEEG